MRKIIMVKKESIAKEQKHALWKKNKFNFSYFKSDLSCNSLQYSPVPVFVRVSCKNSA